MFPALVTLFVAATFATAGDRLVELFGSWEKARAETRSLVVEYTMKEPEPVTGADDGVPTVFRLLRTPEGELYASVDQSAAARPGTGRRLSYLLNGGTIYRLDHATKTGFVVRPAGDGLSEFLETWFSPVVVLLDRRRAEARYTITLVQQDEWYTHLLLRPKDRRKSGWFTPVQPDVQVALMTKASPAIPKDMPRRLRYLIPNGPTTTFDIIAWRLNAADGPTVADFAKPQDRPGWRVVEPAAWPAMK
jgi:hypothetical protein